MFGYALRIVPAILCLQGSRIGVTLNFLVTQSPLILASWKELQLTVIYAAAMQCDRPAHADASRSCGRLLSGGGYYEDMVCYVHALLIPQATAA
jgi:hypothetical protein